MSADTEKMTERDLFVATCELPDWLDDETFYDFQNPAHPLTSIGVCRPQIVTAALEGWVPQQRERIANTQVYGVSHVETFSNPHFPIQGFQYWNKSDDARSSVFIHATVGGTTECVTLIINAASDRLGLVHALLERLAPASEVVAPLDGWIWRQLFRLFIPIPEGATVPHDFHFSRDEARVSVNCAASKSLLALSPLANDKSILVESPVETVTPQGFRATALTGSAVDAIERPVTLVSGFVELAESNIAMAGRAAGDQRAALERIWSRAVASTKLKES